MPGLSARPGSIDDPYETGFRDLADFFEGLAQDFRGWEGVRSWRAVSGELYLEARHSGHIELRVTVREEAWRVTADLRLDPGEQLRGIAEDLRYVGRAT